MVPSLLYKAMFLIFVLLFTVVPALEIYLLFQVGGEIGILNTFLIVVATGVIGAALAKRQGLEILARMQKQMHQGQLPAKEIQQAFLVFAGGLLLLTPGFITDILGLSFILPISRSIWRVVLNYLFQKAVQSGAIHVVSSPPPYSQSGPHYTRRENSGGGEVIDVDFERRS